MVSAVKNAKAAEESRMQKIADRIQATADKLREQVKGRVQASGTKAKGRSVDMAISLVKLQQSAIDRAFKVLANLQKHSDKLVKQHIQGADWMPPEGKDIVKEWSRMLNEGREEFQKTLDKSYDLLKGGLERVRKEQVADTKKKTPAKAAGAAKKKTTVRKKKRTAAPAAKNTASSM